MAPSALLMLVVSRLDQTSAGAVEGERGDLLPRARNPFLTLMCGRRTAMKGAEPGGQQNRIVSVCSLGSFRNPRTLLS